jgi:hypothetical protein
VIDFDWHSFNQGAAALPQAVIIALSSPLDQARHAI